MAKIETEYTDLPTCPYCGARDQDYWDHDWEGREIIEVPCGACELDYSLERHQSISFTTRPVVQSAALAGSPDAAQGGQGDER